MTENLDLADYLLIAEAVTGVPAETLARLPRLDLAESALHAPQAEFGGVEFHPDFVMKAAVLCSRLLKNHPMPDGDKRAAWVSLQEFSRRRTSPRGSGRESRCHSHGPNHDRDHHARHRANHPRRATSVPQHWLAAATSAGTG